MIPYLSREQWLALGRESYVVDTHDRSMIKVAGHAPAFLGDELREPFAEACPVILGRVVRHGQPIGRPKAAFPLIHHFQEDRWCEVDINEIYNVFFFAPEWLPLLPQ